MGVSGEATYTCDVMAKIIGSGLDTSYYYKNLRPKLPATGYSIISRPPQAVPLLKQKMPLCTAVTRIVRLYSLKFDILTIFAKLKIFIKRLFMQLLLNEPIIKYPINRFAARWYFILHSSSLQPLFAARGLNAACSRI